MNHLRELGSYIFLVDVSNIFNFFLRGGGEGGVWGDSEGVVGLLIENPRRGGGQGGREGVCREFGEGLNLFFRCRNVHQVFQLDTKEHLNQKSA